MHTKSILFVCGYELSTSNIKHLDHWFAGQGFNTHRLRIQDAIHHTTKHGDVDLFMFCMHAEHGPEFDINLTENGTRTGVFIYEVLEKLAPRAKFFIFDEGRDEPIFRNNPRVTLLGHIGDKPLQSLLETVHAVLASTPLPTPATKVAT